ncbi:MAG TPA: c-type cytochrome, partial [Burkholderiales bacterium]
MRQSKVLKIGLASLAAVAVLLGALYAFIVWEGSSAREDAPALEARIAQWLLYHTVPADYRGMKNPLGANAGSPDIPAGAEVYRSKCEQCHAYDGRGKTEIASGEYPRPPDLRGAGIQAMSDGEVFYHIKFGIRHTGMPAWTLPDRKIWQVVAYLRHLPQVAALSPHDAGVQPAASVASAHYVGSPACKTCHEDIYARWKDTRMANVVRDPREHPDAVIPDFSKPDPLVTFPLKDVALTYGSKWKQRYFKQVGDDYFVFPVQWDVTHKVWRPYFV